MKISDRREKFFNESLKLIHQKGFKATTMRDIAKQMGFEVANIYNYIPSKQALLERFLFDLEKEYNSTIDNIIASSYSPTEKLKAILSFHVRSPYEKPYQTGLMLNEWKHLKEPKKSEFLTNRYKYAKKISKVVREGIEAGEIRDMNVKVITNSILSSVRWLYREYTSSRSNMNPIELERQVLEYVFHGISPKD